jgi:hypothetical protein
MPTSTMNSYDDTRVPFRAVAAGQTGVFLNAVYGWMCFGLVITARLSARSRCISIS